MCVGMSARRGRDGGGGKGDEPDNETEFAKRLRQDKLLAQANKRSKVVGSSGSGSSSSSSSSVCVPHCPKSLQVYRKLCHCTVPLILNHFLEVLSVVAASL